MAPGMMSNFGSVFLFGMGLGLAMIMWLAVYVYTSAAMYTIAKKTRTKDEWMAWIPIVNLYLTTKIAKVPWWTMLIVIFGWIIPFIGTLAILGIMVWWFWKIAEVRHKPGWLSILMLIPIVNFIIIGVLAWAD